LPLPGQKPPGDVCSRAKKRRPHEHLWPLERAHLRRRKREPSLPLLLPARLKIVEKPSYNLSVPSTRSETRFGAREGASYATETGPKVNVPIELQRSCSVNTHAQNSNLNGRISRYAEISVDSAPPGRARGAKWRATARQDVEVN
jgi:hypothetical protein